MKLISSLNPVGSLWALATCFVLLLVLDQCETMMHVSKLSAVRAGSLIRKNCVIPKTCIDCVPPTCVPAVGNPRICNVNVAGSNGDSVNGTPGHCGGETDNGCVTVGVCGYPMVPICIFNEDLFPFAGCEGVCELAMGPMRAGCF